MKLITGSYEQCTEYCKKNTGEKDGNIFIFDFPYISIEERFREIDRFIWESKHTLRFANRFCGTAIVDVTAWNRSYPNQYFDAFLYYIKDNENHIDCFFISECDFSTDVTAHISKLFHISPVSLSSERLPSPRGIGFSFAGERSE